MKKAKSLLAIILCIVMLFAFAGCGEQQTVSTITETEDEWETEVIEGEENVSGGEREEMVSTTISQGDSAATVALAKNKEFLNSLKGLEINIYTMQSEKPIRGTVSGDRYFSILDKVSKKYGVTINYLDKVPGNLQQSILSGAPAANVISIQDYHYISWMNAGVAADLTAAMKKTGITFKESWYKSSATKVGNLNGKQYAFNADIYEPMLLVYNKRLLQESGLSDPIELYNSGKWTFDKLGEYLKKLKKTSSDGTVIVNGLGIPSGPSLVSMLVSMNACDMVVLKDGNMKANLSDSKIKTALEYYSKWRNVDKTIAGSVDWKAAYTDFSKGNIGMVLATKYIFDNMNDNNMTDAVGVIPFPYGPNASANTEYSYTQLFLNVIPKSEQKNADKILFVMNEVYKEQYAVREDDFADTYRTLIRNNSSYEIFKDYSLGNKNMKLSYFNISGIPHVNGGWTTICQNIASGVAVETALKTASTSSKTLLEELWGKYKITG